MRNFIVFDKNVSRHGIHNWNTETEELLSQAIRKETPFETDWGSDSENNESFSIVRDTSLSYVLHVCLCMDEGYDLVFGAYPPNVEHRQELDDEILTQYMNQRGISEITRSFVLPKTVSITEIKNKLQDLAIECDIILKNNFEMMRKIIITKLNIAM